MTSDGLHDVGEEWAWKTTFRQDLIGTRDTEFEVLLYDDATDTLTDSSDVGDITTEPTDGNYVRQTVNLDDAAITLSQESGNIRARGEVTFDVDGTTGTVDAAATVIEIQSDIVNSEGSANPHLLDSATLDAGSQDLTNFTSLQLQVDITIN